MGGREDIDSTAILIKAVTMPTQVVIIIFYRGEKKAEENKERKRKSKPLAAVEIVTMRC